MLGKIWCIAIILLGSLSVRAQDCLLGIGGENTEIIIKTFQLNESQIATMEALRGELSVNSKSLEDQIEKLLAEHPQSKEEDLITMGDKYKALQAQLIQVSIEADKSLLEAFNAKQYERYLELCKAAIRKPIFANPMEYETESKEE